MTSTGYSDRKVRARQPRIPPVSREHDDAALLLRRAARVGWFVHALEDGVVVRIALQHRERAAQGASRCARCRLCRTRSRPCSDFFPHVSARLIAQLVGCINRYDAQAANRGRGHALNSQERILIYLAVGRQDPLASVVHTPVVPQGWDQLEDPCT